MNAPRFNRQPLPTPVLVKEIICDPKDESKVQSDLRAVNMEITQHKPGVFKARLKSSPSIPARQMLQEMEAAGTIRATDTK